VALDQIGLYHLVMFDGLDTEWSRDRSLLQQLPDNEAACARWLALRASLLGRGFVQTTLTNFERAGLGGAGKGFSYERLGFSPETHDCVGYGPGAITLRCVYLPGGGLFRGTKGQNPATATAYAQAEGRRTRWDRIFSLDHADLRVLYLTRKIALLGVDQAAYGELFGDAARHLDQELHALTDAGLVEVDRARISVTPRGMFFADTIAGLIASRRVREIRTRQILDGHVPGRAHAREHLHDAMG
jgi:coproporphyrinogen III oxidase-like Fe-S oxidoreductase